MADLITIEYTAEGVPVSDFNLNSFINRIVWAIKSNHTAFLPVSTSGPIWATLAAIHDGVIPHDEVVLVYQGHRYFPFPNGLIEGGHPNGLGTTVMEIIARYRPDILDQWR